MRWRRSAAAKEVKEDVSKAGQAWHTVRAASIMDKPRAPLL